MLLNGENNTFVRISDFLGVIPAITGKIELVYEGELEGPGKVANILLGKAIKTLMLNYFPDPEKLKKAKATNPYTDIINWFANGNTISLVDDLSLEEYTKALESVPGLKTVIKTFHKTLSKNQQILLMEFLLHGLSEFSLINKSFLDKGFSFNDMFNSLFNTEFEDDDEYNEDRDNF
jgi:magnesium chelatase subunit I